MRWSKSINVVRLRLSQQAAGLVFCVAMLFLPGCTATWESRKHDLRTVWGGTNAYSRLSFGYERRHHFAPSNPVVNDYRWLHGPVPLIPSSSVAGRGYELGWQSSAGSMPGNSPVNSTGGLSGTMNSVPAIMPDIETLNPPTPDIKPAPASKTGDNEKVRPPVEIMLPPLESLREPSSGSGQGDHQWHSRQPSVEGPTAINQHEAPIRPVRYQYRKAALPGSSILFARP